MTSLVLAFVLCVEVESRCPTDRRGDSTERRGEAGVNAVGMSVVAGAHHGDGNGHRAEQKPPGASPESADDSFTAGAYASSQMRAGQPEPGRRVNGRTSEPGHRLSTSADGHWITVGAYAGLTLADLILTEQILALPNTVETNPLMESKWARYGVNALMVGAFAFMDTKLKGAWKWVCRVVLIGLRGVAVGHNWSELRHARTK